MVKHQTKNKKSQVVKQETVKTATDVPKDNKNDSTQLIQNIAALLDHKNPDLTWKEKYGYVITGINKTNHLGQAVGSSGYKAVLKQVGNQKPFWRATIPLRQPFTPEEAIDDIAQGLERRLLDSFPDLKKSNFKIEFIKKYYSRGEDIQHWLIQTNRKVRIQNSYAGENDDLKLGLVIRNGYNTSTSLGIDIFTFRRICSNGAIARGTDLAKTSMWHIAKNPEMLVKQFHEALLTVVPDWDAIIELYNTMAKTKLTLKMAQFIYQQNGWMPDKYFPEYYNIPTKDEIKKAKEKDKPVPLVTLTNAGKNVTMWEDFNNYTYKIWRAQDRSLNTDEKEQKKKPVGFWETAWQEKNLHRSMINILNNPERFV